MNEPRRDLADPKELLLSFLDSCRAAVGDKLAGLSEEHLRMSQVPSGWTPLGLLKHLVHMERRWLVWGFLAKPVAEPFGDHEEPGRWYASPAETAEELLAALAAGGERTRAIVSAADLADVAAVGGRFGPDDVPPTLAWTLHHVLNEYSRHLGHLDIGRELVDGRLGD